MVSQSRADVADDAGRVRAGAWGRCWGRPDGPKNALRADLSVKQVGRAAHKRGDWAEKARKQPVSRRIRGKQAKIDPLRGPLARLAGLHARKGGTAYAISTPVRRLRLPLHNTLPTLQRPQQTGQTLARHRRPRPRLRMGGKLVRRRTRHGKNGPHRLPAAPLLQMRLARRATNSATTTSTTARPFR